MTALNQQFQLSQQTREDRFPKIFTLVQRSLPKAKTILSFGCSTGMECFTLTEKYFPKAKITGCEINQYALSQAVYQRDQRKLKNVVFTSELKGEYDIVFALMVFFSIENPVPKERFDQGVRELAKHVKPGGLIAFHNLEHPFSVRGFKPIRTWRHKNNRSPDKEYYGGVFQKKTKWFWSRWWGKDED